MRTDADSSARAKAADLATSTDIEGRCWSGGGYDHQSGCQVFAHFGNLCGMR
ncbi:MULTISPECIES: hypothetical protein [unclassified Mesorhizobium]|uniref:hypothetical protein n=1 Tax=unclassified Mesorhizobium TaxID=325217 RepID=UPI001CCEDCB0|nr:MULTISPECIES: hypothetical protein [unclassified Mesorhizobium]MBZ9739913.1 hypothetical protein [Mesorhizobium sp. CO1-1-4]MBZ9805726.1 hypothetical protein [Mesorhizobium sp. ES1-6]